MVAEAALGREVLLTADTERVLPRVDGSGEGSLHHSARRHLCSSLPSTPHLSRLGQSSYRARVAAYRRALPSTVPCATGAAAMLARLLRRAPSLTRPANRQPTWLYHYARAPVHYAPEISVFPAKQTQHQTRAEEERESGQSEAAAAEERQPQRRGVHRRQTHTLRRKADHASSLPSTPDTAEPSSTSPAASTDAGIVDSSSTTKRRSRRSVFFDEGESTSGRAQTDSRSTRSSTFSSSSSARSDSHSSSSSSSSSSARRATASALPSSAFGASSVTSRLSFGIQQVLSFVYAYLPKPTPAQITADQEMRSQHSAHAAAGDRRSPATSASSPLSPASLLPSPSSSPVPPPPSPPVHPVSVYDVSSRSIFNDYVVVLLVSSSRQLSFLSSQLYKLARSSNAAPLNRRVLSLSGRTRDDWQSVDLGSVVVHLFNSRARLSKPGLDYHPEASLDVPPSASPAASLWGARTSEERGVDDAPLLRHAVIDNIERQFGDLLVPLERYSELRDHGSGEAAGREGGSGGEPTLVSDTPTPPPS